jgi:threonine-phosphate decarboxylase
MNKPAIDLHPIDDRHGGDIIAAGRTYRRGRFLDLSINLNPWGPPARLWWELLKAVPRIGQYPQPYTADGAARIAAFFGVPESRIALGNGAAELIAVLPRVLPVRRAIVWEPTFSEYRRAFGAAGKPVRQLLLGPEYQVNLSVLETEIGPGDLLFICQPNNPTGRMLPEAVLRSVLELAERSGAWLAVDESFLWFCGSILELTSAGRLERNPRLIIINSLTKIGSVPGLRLGFMMAAPEVTRAVQSGLNQWNVNRMAQQILPAVLDRSFLDRSWKLLAKENRWLQEKLAGISGIAVEPWEANFYLVKLEMAGISAADIVKKLGQWGILVRDCRNFAGLGRDYFRVAVGRRAQNRTFLENLADCLE